MASEPDDLSQTHGTALSRAAWRLLLCAPLSVLATMLVGALALYGWNRAIFVREMVVAGGVTVTGGIIAVMPLVRDLRRNYLQKLANKALLSVVLRPLLALSGTFLALAPAFGLAKLALVFWMLGYYFPLLVAETAVTASILKRLDQK